MIETKNALCTDSKIEDKYIVIYKEYLNNSKLTFEEEEAVRKFFLFLRSKV